MKTRHVVSLLWIASGLLEPSGVEAQAQQAQAEEPVVSVVRRSPPSSWTSDRRLFKAGDLVTIFVDEETLATATADNLAINSRRFDGILSRLGSSRTGFLIRNDTDSEESGRAQRRDRFQTEITARVTEVDENGLLKLEGSKTVKVDKHEHEVVIRGVIRAEDVTAGNVVDAWRMSGLELLYESNGELVSPSKGMLARLLSIIF